MTDFNDQSHCGACKGTSVLTPQAPNNATGLARVSFRAGLHEDFYQSMAARLSSSEYGSLGILTTRSHDDFTMALLDAWAASCDVLTFYNEMWLNEAYVRTAQIPQSLHEMATLIDYVPHPGAAASADLSFSIAAGPGIPEQVTVAAGTKVQSTPGQDETPVIFETLDDLDARAEWNAIRPKLTAPHPLTASTTQLPFEGINTRLKAGDGIAFTADDGTSAFAVVNAVTPVLADVSKDPESKDLTWVTVSPIGNPPLSEPSSPSGFSAADSFTSLVEEKLGETLSESQMFTLLTDAKTDEKTFIAPLKTATSEIKRAQVFRASAAIFGHAAPPLSSLHHSLTGMVPVYSVDDSDVVVESLEQGPYFGKTDATWADQGTLALMNGGGNQLFLERPVAEIGVDSDVIVRDGDNWAQYSVSETADVSVSFFAVTGKSSRLSLDRSDHFNQFTIRQTTVFGASEWLSLADPPITQPLNADHVTVVLNDWFVGLEEGRKVILNGLAEGSGDTPVIATRTVQSISHDISPSGGTSLTLTEPLGADYFPQSLRIAANVAGATQGESAVEVLGDGGAKPHVTLSTRQAPQTFVPAATPSGVKPTLEVRVNKILWHQVPNFLNSQPADRVYTLRVDEQGYSHVTFGDGVQGAMPGKGQQNIRASYRKTHGLMGRVKPGQLNMLMSQPLGVQGVDNLLGASGGADPEGRDAIRLSAPLSCRTLGRVVSITDYADFAQGYGGIAKASAQWLHVSGGPQVVVTVAAEAGAQVDEDSDLYTYLTDALIAAGDPFARFILRSFRHTFFKLGVRLEIHSDYLSDDVLAKVEQTLRAALSFEARRFGQPVFASEILALIHDVAGVEAAVIDRLYVGNTPKRHDGIAAAMAEVGSSGAIADVLGASMLSLHPGPLDYLEVSE
ncbi:hypothetical protein LRP50_09520 [Enterovibrio sp. ZSDZ42]|uniref:Baseplate protein J-like domain-containing protein n=1 Tax=Enterovibrio gelatinilyticus TaxID=2899819 RepID=A0ABT5R038_9GAMM|nr:hypothetical protein [Enterovibrio sp. ZSDZ42]MDD1793364.1 hypothetical protein [Enterovibrio sp. ZSDZ42]